MALVHPEATLMASIMPITWIEGLVREKGDASEPLAAVVSAGHIGVLFECSQSPTRAGTTSTNNGWVTK